MPDFSPLTFAGRVRAPRRVRPSATRVTPDFACGRVTKYRCDMSCIGQHLARELARSTTVKRKRRDAHFSVFVSCDGIGQLAQRSLTAMAGTPTTPIDLSGPALQFLFLCPSAWEHRPHAFTSEIGGETGRNSLERPGAGPLCCSCFARQRLRRPACLK